MTNDSRKMLKELDAKFVYAVTFWKKPDDDPEGKFHCSVWDGKVDHEFTDTNEDLAIFDAHTKMIGAKA